jgi:hypothetical protein
MDGWMEGWMDGKIDNKIYNDMEKIPGDHQTCTICNLSQLPREHTPPTSAVAPQGYNCLHSSPWMEGGMDGWIDRWMYT